MENRIIFAGVFAVVIGGLLLLSCIGLAIYFKIIGQEVKTWMPFGLSGGLGLLILVRIAKGVNMDEPVPPSRLEVEPPHRESDRRAVAAGGFGILNVSHHRREKESFNLEATGFG